MIICSDFWINFWPNFISTVAGLILGLPLAIWTNHLFTKSQLINQKRTERERLIKALTVLKETMIENKSKLQITVATLNQNKVQFDTQVDSSVWEVVKPEIIQVLHDPKLQKKLAYHFSAMTSFVDLNRLYLNLNVGVNGAMTGMEPTKNLLKNNLINMANALITETNEIELLIVETVK